MFINDEQPRLGELRIRRDDFGRVAAIRDNSYVYAATLCRMYCVLQSRPIALDVTRPPNRTSALSSRSEGARGDTTSSK